MDGVHLAHEKLHLLSKLFCVFVLIRGMAFETFWDFAQSRSSPVHLVEKFLLDGGIRVLITMNSEIVLHFKILILNTNQIIFMSIRVEKYVPYMSYLIQIFP